MLVIAKAVKGKEFIYSAKSARQVSKRSANTICNICNQCKYQIANSEIWHIYEIDCYDTAYIYAQSQAFKIRKGIVSDCVI
jgi:hypothetical protein